MTSRQKRWAFVAAAVGVVAVAVGLIVQSQRLTAEEQAYAGTWYSADAPSLFQELRLAEGHRIDIVLDGEVFETSAMVSTWWVADGRLIIRYGLRRSPWVRFRQAVDPWAPVLIDVAGEHVAEVGDSPSGPLTFTSELEPPFTVYRTKAEANANPRRSIDSETEPEPQAVEAP